MDSKCRIIVNGLTRPIFPIRGSIIDPANQYRVITGMLRNQSPISLDILAALSSPSQSAQKSISVKIKLQMFKLQEFADVKQVFLTACSYLQVMMRNTKYLSDKVKCGNKNYYRLKLIITIHWMSVLMQNA